MIDVSIVLVSFNMQRELPRTLFSLSKSYQLVQESLSVELIVVDNGSTPTPNIDEFSNLNIDLQIISCRTHSKSPVFAINQGLEYAKGKLIGVWIDAARLASPGLIQACFSASKMAARPVIATLNWQLGPQRQFLAPQRGYDQRVEDELLDSIDWPQQPYRLFDISIPEVKEMPTGSLLESNALFMPRELWNELGGYDVAFDEPGGGAVNPDMLIRALNLPRTQLIRIDGEATFHQIHGGLTTSGPEQAMKVLKDSSAKYYKLRGYPLRHIQEVGLVYNARPQRGQAD
ncbi:MAG TPA: glycosyltransferase family 2 protein [Methyloprofundus sp.]|nr:glycosyltransferase family 2 protein [Methyloprofundus sp.]HIM07045.1 glycosyltransferase family 2 protein [Gammaproteobacteria bacterium]